MASKSTMKIQFPRGGTIPKEVLKSNKDKKCDPGEVVTVPKTYGDHLVSDRFAVEAKASTKGGKAEADKKKAELAKLEAAVSDAKVALEKADTDEAKATAQAALDAAEKALADASA